jgi:predicted dehydrogenase
MRYQKEEVVRILKPIRIGVIGVGQMGKRHIERYSEIEGVEVAAVAARNEVELKKVASMFNIPDIYTNFEEMLKRDDIDAVDVCLHNNLHAPVSIKALRAGKHVYCEKPIAGSYADGKAMIDTAKEYGKMLHIQLSLFYTKETKAAKQLIDQGKLGEIYHARSTGYRRRFRPYVDGYGKTDFVKKEISGGGALLDVGVYNISQILYLLDMPKVKRISGKTYQKTNMDLKRKESSGYNVEELATGFIRFEKDITLDIIDSWAIHLNEFEGSSLAGTQGGIRLSPFSFHTTIADMEADCTFDLNNIENRWKMMNQNDDDAYENSQKHWVAALQGRVELLPTAEVTLQTLLISEGIYLSDQLQREVAAEEVIALSKSSALVL